jgi:hypothetical protein
METVEYTIKVFDNFIEITPVNGVLDNSIYDIKIKDLKELNGKRVLDSVSFKLCTTLTPAYTTIDAVNSLIASCNVPEDVILYHIREASRFVNYVKGMSYNSGSIPFEVDQYVKYKAAHECILRFYITRASQSGQKGTLGDVTFDTGTAKSPDITELLKELKAEATVWYEAIRGYKNEGRAKPVSAIKGGNIITTRPSNETPPKRTDWSGGNG